MRISDGSGERQFIIQKKSEEVEDLDLLFFQSFLQLNYFTFGKKKSEKNIENLHFKKI